MLLVTGYCFPVSLMRQQFLPGKRRKRQEKTTELPEARYNNIN